MRLAVFPALFALVAVTACSKKPEAATQPEVALAPAAAGPHGDAAAAPDSSHQVTGKVVESMDAGGYTYLHLTTAEGQERWAAVNQAKIEAGKTVTVVNAMVVPSFHSPKLGRDFKDLYLGELGEAGAAPALKGGNATAAAAAHGAHAASTVPIDSPITRAEGDTGHTVADLYARKTTLVGKTVAVRGKVAKVNANILGRNWVHVQDGSGAEKDGNFDLVVATADTANVGDIVLARGKLVADKDVSGVYHFAVLLEDALLEKK